MQPTIAMHLIGSRTFGGVKPTSDWDAIYQDTPEVRVWLKACGFIEYPSDYERKPEFENVSFWRHNTYSCECFLVKSEERRRVLRLLVRYSYIFRVIQDKAYRRRVWFSLERCLMELWAIAKEHKAWRQERITAESRLRDRPLRPAHKEAMTAKRTNALKKTYE